MNSRRGGLGRGLGALIPTAPLTKNPIADESAAARTGGEPTPGGEDRSGGDRLSVSVVANHATGGSAPASSPEPAGGMVPVPGATFAHVPVADIVPNSKQPRQVFDQSALDELAHSLREVGFLQPVVVRATGHENDGRPTYELVMGERRWRAAQQAGLDAIPAIVRETGDDAMLRDALLENLHREQLNPLEEGAAYAQLLEEFGATHDELAKRIGRSRSQVTNTIRLLNLPAGVQRKVAAGVLSAGHARALLALDDSKAQEDLATRIVAEGLSVRAVEELVTLGDGISPRRPRKSVKHRAPALDNLATGLSDHFETRVKIDLGRSKGKITIEFASVDDLERIVAAMAPKLASAAREGSTEER